MPQSDHSDAGSELLGGLRVLLNEIVDYAGSFPPASLPLVTALEKYAACRESEWSWLLGRFVCPAARLQELSNPLRQFETTAPLRFSILTAGGDTDRQFLGSMEADLRSAHEFGLEHGDHVVIDQIEARIPRSLLGADVVALRRFIDRWHATLSEAGFDKASVFMEIPMDANLRQTLPVVSGAVAAFNRAADERNRVRFGIKMRTGGTEAADIPPVEFVAQLVVACRDAGVPYKATAGLHHPIRRYHASIGTRMHGFLNLFVAAALAEAHELDEEAVGRILADENPVHFQFAAEHAAWTHLTADARIIERVRARRALSFGSCSIEEPIADLRSLGYIGS